MNQAFTFDLNFETACILFPDYDYNSHVIEYRVWNRNKAAREALNAVMQMVKNGEFK